MRTASLLFLVAIAAPSVSSVSIIACSNAGGNVSGGDVTFDASTQPGPIVDAGADAALPICSIEAEAGAPVTWTGLYEDYFGPTGQGSCTHEPGNCHGGAQEPGFKGSGYMCTTKDACQKDITEGPAQLVRVARDAPDPSKSGLILQLRRLNGKGALTGSMPKRPSNCIFESSAIERIQAWIDAGAPNN